MPLAAARRAQAAETFAQLMIDVHLALYLPPAAAPAAALTAATALQELAWELVELGRELAAENGEEPLLHLREYQADADPEALAAAGITDTPVLALLDADGADAGVRFLGAAAGQEFDLLLEAILALGRGGPAISPLAREQIRLLSRPLPVTILVTPACPRCAQSVRIAHRLAMANPLLQVTAADLTALPHLLDRYQPQTVPVFVLPNGEQFAGPVAELMLVQRLLQAAGEE